MPAARAAHCPRATGLTPSAGRRMFLAGGVAGAVARTCSAPLDRIKLLFQVQVRAGAPARRALVGCLPPSACSAAAPAQEQEPAAAARIALPPAAPAAGPIAALPPLRAGRRQQRHGAQRIHRRRPGGAQDLQASAEPCRAVPSRASPSHPPDAHPPARRLHAASAAAMQPGRRARPPARRAPPTGRSPCHCCRCRREEGFFAFWKGNGINIIRIFPYSAGQLAANDSYKRLLADERGELSLARRLLSGACAGMTATALTHPLDTVRLRLALPGHPYKGALPPCRGEAPRGAAPCAPSARRLLPRAGALSHAPAGGLRWRWRRPHRHTAAAAACRRGGRRQQHGAQRGAAVSVQGAGAHPGGHRALRRPQLRLL
jgi:hypothetical protein